MFKCSSFQSFYNSHCLEYSNKYCRYSKTLLIEHSNVLDVCKHSEFFFEHSNVLVVAYILKFSLIFFIFKYITTIFFQHSNILDVADILKLSFLKH